MRIPTGLGADGTATANAYVVAFIAVGGAIVGAAISALTQGLTSRVSAKVQLTSIEAQLRHQTGEAIWQERRRAYARFMAVSNDWELLTLQVYSAVSEGKKVPRYGGLNNRYVKALRELMLIASEEVMLYAGKMFWQNLDRMKEAEGGQYPVREAGRYPPMGLMALMQRDLGITDGVVVDLATGVRIDKETA